MHCEVKLGDWAGKESTTVDGIEFKRDEVVKLEPKQVGPQIESNGNLEKTWKYTEKDLNKLPVGALNKLLDRVRASNERKRIRRELMAALTEEAKL